MSFYCEKFVNKGRKVKTCCRCGNMIDKGESSYAIPSENFEFTEDMCIPCYNECESKGIENISEAARHGEDNEEE